jgi:DNA-binding winged helix-turn-helix (wHTH) protein
LLILLIQSYSDGWQLAATCLFVVAGLNAKTFSFCYFCCFPQKKSHWRILTRGSVVVLRRIQLTPGNFSGAGDEPMRPGNVIRFGPFELDLKARELRKAGMRIKLGDQPFQILAMLLEHPGELVTREELQQRLWRQDTFVDFDLSLNAAVKKLRQALNDDSHNPRLIETLYRRGYRFIGAVNEVAQHAGQDTSATATLPESAAPASLAESAALEAAPAAAPAPQKLHLGWTAGLTAAVLAALIAVYFVSRVSATKLTDKDTIVLSEFNNTTGDPVFDGALRQGLSSQLEQSPFLNLLSDSRIAQTLALMAQPRDARLTGKLAGEVCQRTASAATIEGSISSMGSEYVLGLRAVNCRSGDVLAQEQATANGKEQVLKTLGEATTRLRRKLGESLASVEKYDVPLENVTTSSLEALQAFSIGYKLSTVKGDFAAARPFSQRAISLDPNFAMAYALLGTGFHNVGENALAGDNARKAYELRERVSERERLYITSHYAAYVTGDIEAALRAYEMWIQTYPRDDIPYHNLGNIYRNVLGDYDKALAAFQESVKLNPGTALARAAVVDAYIALNRLDEAKAAAQDMQAHKLDSPWLHVQLYALDFLRHDPAGMEREAARLMDTPGWEDWSLSIDSATAAYAGQFAKARELNRRAIAFAQRTQKERPAGYEAGAALQEILVGNATLARRRAEAALALSTGRDVEGVSAIALALASDAAQATRLADDLGRRFSEDTAVQFSFLPAIHAALALQKGDAAGAVANLATGARYDFTHTNPGAGYCSFPIYLRGQAFLAQGNAAAAAAEFQRILDHPGVVVNTLTGALAHLQIGRAYALSDETTKARAAYQDFFTLWKNADPDVPILKQAKAEYAKLN